VSTSAVVQQRAKWLINSTDLATLSQINITKLIGVMQVLKFADGEKIYTEGQFTDQIILIDSGKANVSTTLDIAGMDMSEKDKFLGIVKPRHATKNIADMSAAEFASQMKADDDDLAPSDIALELPEGAYEVYDGCLLGINGMRAKAGLDTAGAWKWDESELSTAVPFTVVAKGEVDALMFSRKVFETLFGINSIVPSNKKLSVDVTERVLTKFEAAFFKMKHVLGSGSFGVVVFAESREDPQETFALKFLSKVDVVVTGQLKHLEDERKLLGIMDSKFILRLFGTYQTPHQVVLVTEAITNGDMWSVVYEQFYSKGGLPPKLAVFYSASIVIALSHIHSKGLAYRDLKPENIMIDSKGYPKVIDFGFAKTIPYTKVDETTKESKVYAKSYTLCGTPGISH
jgi:hypothetical protein